jgi:predicted metal-dependent hydrolase
VQTGYHSSGLEHGISLFNQGRYFDAHEVLEEVWRPCRGEERRFLQGLVQVAVALHHHSTGNLRGARSVLQRAQGNLAPYPGAYLGLDVATLRAACAAWAEALASGGPRPAAPQLLSAPAERC